MLSPMDLFVQNSHCSLAPLLYVIINHAGDGFLKTKLRVIYFCSGKCFTLQYDHSVTQLNLCGALVILSTVSSTYIVCTSCDRIDMHLLKINLQVIVSLLVAYIRCWLVLIIIVNGMAKIIYIF